MAARQGRDAGPLTAARRAAQQPGTAQRGHAQAHRDLASAADHAAVHAAGLNPAAADVDPADGTWETSHLVIASIPGRRGRITPLAQETMPSQPTATSSTHLWRNLPRLPSEKNQST